MTINCREEPRRPISQQSTLAAQVLHHSLGYPRAIVTLLCPRNKVFSTGTSLSKTIRGMPSPLHGVQLSKTADSTGSLSLHPHPLLDILDVITLFDYVYISVSTLNEHSDALPPLLERQLASPLAMDG